MADKSCLQRLCIKRKLDLCLSMDDDCLSGIPPGHGTNHNEKLHKDLNRHRVPAVMVWSSGASLCTANHSIFPAQGTCSEECKTSCKRFQRMTSRLKNSD